MQPAASLKQQADKGQMSTHLAKRDAEHALALFKEVFTASPDAIVVTDKAEVASSL